LISERSLRVMGQSVGRGEGFTPDEPPDRARAFPLGAGRDGFGLGYQVTGQHNTPRMRAPGSLSWAGIYNTQFWIDPATGIGGVLLMQYLPFYDAEAIEALQGFERRCEGLRWNQGIARPCPRRSSRRTAKSAAYVPGEGATWAQPRRPSGQRRSCLQASNSAS
jgi:CubicO group peptidase (beta-lactamase class C family)